MLFIIYLSYIFMIWILLEARAGIQKYFCWFFCSNEKFRICFRDYLTFRKWFFELAKIQNLCLVKTCDCDDILRIEAYKRQCQVADQSKAAMFEHLWKEVVWTRSLPKFVVHYVFRYFQLVLDLVSKLVE